MNSICQGWRLCGLGARIAWRKTSSLGSELEVLAASQARNAVEGRRVATNRAAPPTSIRPAPPTPQRKARRLFDMPTSLFVRPHASRASWSQHELTIFLSLTYKNV